MDCRLSLFLCHGDEQTRSRRFMVDLHHSWDGFYITAFDHLNAPGCSVLGVGHRLEGGYGWKRMAIRLAVYVMSFQTENYAILASCVFTKCAVVCVILVELLFLGDGAWYKPRPNQILSIPIIILS